LTELAIGVCVAQPITRYLRTPEALIGLGRAQMLWTAMPEAAIEEHRYSGAWENQISCSAQTRNRPEVHPVPQPQGMYRRAQREFWTSIASAIGPHDSSAGR
jgi:hypothetical protein